MERKNTIPNYKCRPREEFIKKFTKESKIEHPDQISNELQDKLYCFAKNVMNDVYFDARATDQSIVVAYYNIDQTLRKSGLLEIIPSNIGALIEYSYLVLTDDVLGEEIGENKTLRTALEDIMKTIKQKLIDLHKSDLQ